MRRIVRHLSRQSQSLLTRVLNAFFLRGYMWQTTSARAYEMSWLGDEKERRRWYRRMVMIDRLWGDTNGKPHCLHEFEVEQARAAETQDRAARIRELRAMGKRPG